MTEAPETPQVDEPAPSEEPGEGGTGAPEAPTGPGEGDGGEES